ncbi:MAG: HigA family addiction module antidote protein [Deltaproteobacteria bacterium]|nr:HigA family addiction module antidote protein [Deltaproteobacteria bacterium]
MSIKDLLDPITPGEILREDFMEPLGISINRLSRDLAVPLNRISEIVNGKRSITADTALRLERYFGVEAQFWLNLQSEFDLRLIKRKIGNDIEQRIIPVNRARKPASQLEPNSGA